MSSGFIKFIFGLIVLLHNVNAGAQLSSKEPIKHIRKVFTQINGQKNSEQVRVENEELTNEVPDGGVSLLGSFKEKKLLKIEQWAGLSYGIIQIEYYFDNDSLIFVYVSENHFRLAGDTVNYSKLDQKFEGRYYFRNGNLIHKTTKGKGFWSDSNDGLQSLLSDSRTYMLLLYSKKQKGST